MSVTIDKLPDEMLIEVFEYLDGNSVKEAALVCKEWNRIISTSRIMTKFFLKIWLEGPEGDQIFEQLLTLNRQFTSADIFGLNGRQLMQLVKRFGRKLASLTLKHVDWTAETIVEILEKMPELEELEIFLFERKDAASVKPVLMKKLEKLKVCFGTDDVFSLFEAPMLTHLNATVMDHSLKPRMKEILKNFLQASPKLESLTLDFQVLDQIDPGFLFQLKELSCGWINNLTENIKQFLLSQAATVEKLQINSNDSETIEFILTKFKRLKSFSASMSVASDEFFENLEPKPLVKELRLHSAFTSLDSLRVVLRKFPEIEKLKISDILYNEKLEVVAETNKKLKILSTKSMDYYAKPLSLKFPSLRSLEVELCHFSRNFFNFLKANPNIESLFIKNPGNGLNADNIIDLLNETSLKFVIIKDEPEPKKLYHKMESRFATCKTIEMELSSKSLQIHFLREAQQKGPKRCFSQIES